MSANLELACEFPDIRQGIGTIESVCLRQVNAILKASGYPAYDESLVFLFYWPLGFKPFSLEIHHEMIRDFPATTASAGGTVQAPGRFGSPGAVAAPGAPIPGSPAMLGRPGGPVGPAGPAGLGRGPAGLPKDSLPPGGPSLQGGLPTSKPEQPRKEFTLEGGSNGGKKWKELMGRCGYSAEDLDTESTDIFIESNHLASAEVPPESELIFTLRLETDHLQLLEWMEIASSQQQALALYRTASSYGQDLQGEWVLNQPGPLDVRSEHEFYSWQQQGYELEQFGRISPNEVELWLKFQAYKIQKGTEAAMQESMSGYLTIWLSNFSELADYPGGLAAVDLGNNACTLSAMSGKSLPVEDLLTLDLESPSALRILSLEPNLIHPDDRRMGQSLYSAVYLTDYVPPEQKLQVPVCRWLVGDECLNKPDLQGLIIGPKRLLVSGDQSPLKMYLSSGSHEIDRQLPAELILSEILKQAYRAFRYRFGSLAFTYPPTYSSAEIHRTKMACVYGLNRSLCYPFYNVRHESKGSFLKVSLEEGDDSNVEMFFIDEATSAAFFYLYRDYFYGIGRLRTFAYQYEQGVNVLIIDCGGGTTDVALVHARADYKSPLQTSNGQPTADNQESETEEDDENSNAWTVNLDVLGRTGLRRFGGDDITIAVYKVLKATLAEFILQKKSSAELNVPAKGADFPEWYERNFRIINDAVPTEFYRMSLDTDGNRYRFARELTKDLWTWAEKVKQILSPYEKLQSQVPSENPDKAQEELLKIIPAPESRAFMNVIARTGEVYTKLVKKLIETMLKRQDHINVQIHGALEKCLKNTNNMVKERLTDFSRDRHGIAPADMLNLPDLPPDCEIHRVYVVGNASRYPYVQKMIAENLKVRLINHGSKKTWDVNPEKRQKFAEPDWSGATPHLKRIVFDTTNLKDAVAKGALLALKVTRGYVAATFQWDKSLARRLPYTIMFDSFDEPFVEIYCEHESYDQMKLRTVALPRPSERAEDQKLIMLHRKWPGDDPASEPTPFMSFHFPNPLKGPLSIRYVEVDDYFGFEITDKRSGSVRGQYVADPGDSPPMQRGDL